VEAGRDRALRHASGGTLARSGRHGRRRSKIPTPGRLAEINVQSCATFCRTPHLHARATSSITVKLLGKHREQQGISSNRVSVTTIEDGESIALRFRVTRNRLRWVPYLIRVSCAARFLLDQPLVLAGIDRRLLLSVLAGIDRRLLLGSTISSITCNREHDQTN
jgi:hypothetical protein